MPGPSSAAARTIVSSSPRALTVALVPGGWWSTAFAMRLARHCSSRDWSPSSTSGGRRLDGDRGGVGQGVQAGLHRGEQVGKEHQLQPHVDLVATAGDVGEVLQHTAQPVELVPHDRRVRGGEQLQVALGHRQRRAHLVGDRGQVAAPADVALLDPGEHLVQLGGQLGDLVLGSGHGDATGEVGGRDGLRRRRDVADGAQCAAHDQPQDDPATGDADGAGGAATVTVATPSPDSSRTVASRTRTMPPSAPPRHRSPGSSPSATGGRRGR